MEAQTRGRSPSVGQHPEHRIRSSPSPHNFNGHVSPTDFDQPGATASFPSQPFASNNLSPTTDNLSYNLTNSYLDAGPQQYQHPQQIIQTDEFGNQSFHQTYPQDGVSSNGQQASSLLDPQQSDQSFSGNMLNVDTRFGGFPRQHHFAMKQEAFNSNDFMLDPALQQQGGMQPQDRSINPQDIMSNMSSPQNNAPTPPNLMPIHPQHSEPTSPFTNPHQQWSPNHSRHGSLDPTAAYTNGNQQEWGALQGPQFQGHRRAPSEHSDVSSSVAPSPYLAQQDPFDFDRNPSPLLDPQPDNQLYQDGLGIENFNISDNHQRHSPGHSPFVSPRMSPQPGMGMAQDATFMKLPEAQNNYNGAIGPEGYATQNEQFPTLPPEQRLTSNDYGQADQYDVPQINVESAPMSLQGNMENSRFPPNMDALSPPERGRKNRMRAKSDTSISRPVSPSSTQVTLGSNDSSFVQRGQSLSPYDQSYSPSHSRETSPAPRSPSQRRSSTSSIPNRDYILELADPNRPPAQGPDGRIKVQKHPATFSCHLCPKKFTRAYNLRSHLRTHTDERPFVCTVCSKAFARQHDRKRHEGLHSGEKKFVCKGELGNGAHWGCGRRFARADALGRHFRSEAGRVCIKPLLDEEAMERQRMDEQLMAQHMASGMAPQAPMGGMPLQQQFAFPQALLQQFPALQGLQWDQLQGGPDEEELSGRSSFDASSAGEYYEDDDGGSGGYVSDNPMGTGFHNHGPWQHDQGWKSDIEP